MTPSGMIQAMKLILLVLFIGISSEGFAQKISVTDFGVFPDSFADATEGVKKAIEACRGKSSSVLNFPPGRYDFWPDKADEHILYITNSSSEEEYPSKKQKAGLFFQGLKHVLIEGNQSLFVFHGKMISWVFDHCDDIRLQNVRIDYERPGMSEMTIRSISKDSVVAVVHPDSKFTILHDTLEWYGEKWLSRNFHAILVNPRTGVNLYSSWDPFRNSKAQVIAPLTVKFTGDFSGFNAAPGEVLTIRDRYRDYVGAFVNRSKNIALHNVHMQFMHGLGIVSQFAENLDYDSVYIEPAVNSGRMMASSADGMHFSGCKGQITIDHCRFRGLHDDAVNVHGTHLKITEIVSPVSLKIRFMHEQTYGFEAFIAGDSIAFVHPASLQIFEQGIIKTARLINPKEMLVEFTAGIPKSLKVGDMLENVTWTPSLTLKNTRIEGTNTRGLLVTTRRKVVVEHNVFFRTGMHAILIENDALGWFESGPVTDVTIRNNVFEECAYNSAPDNYVINIHPQNKQLLRGYWVHKNIVISHNVFRVYDDPLLSARSVNGLSFTDNTVIRTHFLPAGKKRAGFHLTADTHVLISNNSFGTEDFPEVLTEKMKESDLVVKK